jgi:hypothetical protein
MRFGGVRRVPAGKLQQEEVTMVVAEQALIDGVLERIAQKDVCVIGLNKVSEYLFNHADMADPLELAAADAAGRFPTTRLSLQLYRTQRLMTSTLF